MKGSTPDIYLDGSQLLVALKPPSSRMNVNAVCPYSDFVCVAILSSSCYYGGC